ncbi:hypothetical protein J6590_078347 [Homalodisca vitripennis]|nr:hypothetical protein J6590_078347 [Homalodisca vitripennis]
MDVRGPSTRNCPGIRGHNGSAESGKMGFEFKIATMRDGCDLLSRSECEEHGWNKGLTARGKESAFLYRTEMTIR